MKKFFLFLFFLLILATYYLLLTTPISAQSPCQPTSSSIRSLSGGLITTPDTSTNTKFYSQTGTCIFDPKSSFAPFKIPTYDDLKSLYYTQSKAPTNTITTLPATIADGTVYFVASDLTIPSVPANGGSAVIFVGGNLNITGNYTYGNGTTGTVFIVKGNINIDINSNRIDAVLISEGQGGYSICTSYEFSSSTCPVSHITPQPISYQLIVNGSLISLNKDNPIRFRRSLTDNTLAAEVVNQQPKYLVLLRNILSEKLSKWSEVTEDVIQ